jgi:hypothetical protein
MSVFLDRRATMSHLLFLSAVGLCVLTVSNSSLAAYALGQQVQSREITSEDFTKSRPPTQTSKSAVGSQPKQNIGNKRTKRRVYHPISPTAIKTPLDLTTEQIGITIWRLRASTVADSSPKIPVHEGGGITWWTPERTRAETLFKIGDRVRLSIESPRAGYLYVIDREQYADGTLGAPLLVFPTLLARGGDNHVGAGVLVEIPDQADHIPYFNLTRGRNDQVGEILTVLVTPQPIKEIPLAPKQFNLSPNQIAQWENLWATQVEMFEMEGGAGIAWTQAEQQAGAVSGRSLTQDEPTPQTIYRVRVKPGDPLLVTVPLRYGRVNTPE